MKKSLVFLFIFMSICLFSQVDYSDNWEDFYSYNNVKDFVISGDNIYAVADNAIFIYNITTQENTKLSSVHGLSGNTTTSLFYNETYKRLVIGYETGLIEVVKEDGSIHISNDVERLTITGSKKINHIAGNGNASIIYIATAFAILEYNIENLEFGDTFYIGNGSTTVNIKQTEMFNNRIYAATENGIYHADINNTNLIDFNNWTQPQGVFLGNFTAIQHFNNQLYAAKNNILYQVTLPNTLVNRFTFPQNINNLNASSSHLSATLTDKAYFFNTAFTPIIANTTLAYNFELNNSFYHNNTSYLATKKFGILSKENSNTTYQEIHPDGPLFNSPFSIEVQNNHLWVVYGGYTLSWLFANQRKGFSHFNGTNWINTPYTEIEGVLSLVDITIDQDNENNAYLSSYGDGVLRVIDDQVDTILTDANSGLETWIFGNDQFLIGGSAYDKEGNLWVANGWATEQIKQLKTNNTWLSYSIEDIITSAGHGLGEIVIDNYDNKWITSRDYGALVINKNGSKKKALTTTANKGELPSNKVKAIAVDKNNRIWIGTIKGLVRFDNVSGVFDADNYVAKPIIISLEGGTDGGQGQVLLGEQHINTIAIDGADNKWFGTNNSGVLGTNPSGQKTLQIFNKSNSPLPSNQIFKIRVDDSTGKVYFATAKGIVVYNNNVAPFGETLGETYAYPNPSTKNNEFITIDGRNGTHLPRRTNVKILDSAGYLVHETNVIEGTELKGGKVIWNKTNLAGSKVASGVYIILLTLPDKSETSITKVAIIN